MIKLLLVLLSLVSVADAAKVTVCASGCTHTTVQTAIDAVACGDIIEIQEAVVGQWTLRAQGCSNAYTTIRGLNSHLFPQGVRVTDADVADLPDITVGSAIPLIISDSGADSYIIEGLEFKLTGTQDPFGLIHLFHQGSQCGCDDGSSLADLPHDIIFRHVLATALNRNQSNFRNCIVANTGSLVIEDSSFDVCYNAVNAESHGLAAWNASGPFLIRNSFFSASQINTLVGGAAPQKNGLVLRGYKSLGNHYYRPPSWRVRSGTSDPTGACAWDANGGESFNQTMSGNWWLCVSGTWTDQGAGTSSQVATPNKNSYELKHVNGSVVFGSVMEGGWDNPNAGSQKGAAVLLNQVDTNNLHAVIANVDISYNLFTALSWGYVEGIIGSGYYQKPQRIRVRHNVGRLGSPAYVTATPTWAQLGTYGDRSFDHNTILFDRDSVDFGLPINAAAVGAGTLSINANIIHYGGAVATSGGFNESFGGGGGLWNAVKNATDLDRQIGFNVWINSKSCVLFSQSCVRKNGMTATGTVDDTYGYLASPASREATSNAAVDFVDYSGGDFTLNTTSPYYRLALGGVDLGADIPRVDDLTSCAQTGCSNPALDYWIHYINPTSTTAALGYTAYSTAACTVKAAPSPAGLASPTFSATDSGGSRWRTVSITGLSAYTRYYVEITCASTHVTSQFFMTKA